MEFVVNIPAEKRRIKEMRYKVFLSDSAYLVQDIKNKTILKKLNNENKMNTAQDTNENLEGILHVVIEVLEQLFQKHGEEDQPHMSVDLISESVYLNNLLNNYMPLWKEQEFANRPNSEYLKRLQPLLEKCKIKSHRIGRSENDTLKLLVN